MFHRMLLSIVVLLLGASFSLAAPVAPVHQTGQVACWDSGGTEIACGGTGMDGDLKQGVVWPDPRFTANGDQTVTDNLTGLRWSRDASPGGARTWIDALDYIKQLNTGNYLGYSDWRLPNIQELRSLTTLQQYTTTWLLNQGFINVESNYYWTSTTHEPTPTDAWRVYMVDGHIAWSAKNNSFGVWPVRGGNNSANYFPPHVTGQTLCYGADGSSVECSGSGQDGEILAGMTVLAGPRFQPSADKTVYDQATGLVWPDDANTPGPAACANGTAKTWSEAFTYVKCLNNNSFLGRSDWRVPNRNELYSIINHGLTGGNIAWLNGNGFKNIDTAYYWVSDSFFTHKNYAWIISLDGGDAGWDPKTSSHPVFPVSRDGSPPVAQANPQGGSYLSAQTVTLSTNEAATIYYTTNGADPTAQSAAYGSPLNISSSTVVKFFAVDAAGNRDVIRTESYEIQNAVNGVCGSAHGGVFTAAPTSNLCSEGVASAVTGTGPWSWTCAGTNGGTNASCGADIKTYVVQFTASAGGALSGTTTQNVKHGGGTTAVTAAPAAGYLLVNWTGTGGFVTTTTNPLVVGNVTADMTITANFTPSVTITSKPLTKDLPFKGAKKKVAFTAGALTLEQIKAAIVVPSWILVDYAKVKFAKGKGSVPFIVGGNDGIEKRTGTIRIGSAVYTVTQAPTPCVIKSVVVSKIAVPKAGGVSTVSVDVYPEACTWKVASAVVTPCEQGTEQACLDGWFADSGSYPDISEILTGDKVFSGTVKATDYARTLKGIVQIAAGGKSEKKFSIKQLGK